MIGYSVLRKIFGLKKINLEGDIIASGGVFSVEYENYMERDPMPGPFLVQDNSDYIYQINSYEPEIHKLTSDLKLVKTFSRKPSFYSRLKEDFSDFRSDPSGYMNKVNKLLNSATLTRSIHMIREGLLLVQYIELGEKAGSYLDICTTDGEYLTQETISFERPILVARDNYAYQTYQPQPNQEGQLPNPVIVEYRFKYKL